LVAEGLFAGSLAASTKLPQTVISLPSVKQAGARVLFDGQAEDPAQADPLRGRGSDAPELQLVEALSRSRYIRSLSRGWRLGRSG
jgi:hypothetical protein